MSGDGGLLAGANCCELPTIANARAFGCGYSQFA
jgi:hypothetical protein